MTDKKKQEEKAAEEAVVEEPTASEEGTAEKGGSEETGTPKRQRKSSWLSWLILILIIGGLSTGWVMMPEKNRQQVIAFVTSHFNQIEPSHKKEPTPESAPEPTSAPQPAASEPEPAMPAESAATLPKEIPAELPAATPPAEKQPMTTAPTKEPAQAATPAQISALTASIDRLTSELRDMRSEQRQLQQAILAQQQLQLRSRLNRIADGASRLPQMAADWQDILLLPILSKTQRTEAESMQQLAAADTANLQGWQKQLERLAGSLPTPKHHDVIPKPQNSWLSWLTGQFHLRPAPTAEQQAIEALHDRLIDASHALAAESWPDAKSWKALLDETRKRLGKKVDLGLPEEFSGLQQDKMKMQALAQNWLEQL